MATASTDTNRRFELAAAAATGDRQEKRAQPMSMAERIPPIHNPTAKAIATDRHLLSRVLRLSADRLPLAGAIQRLWLPRTERRSWPALQYVQRHAVGTPMPTVTAQAGRQSTEQRTVGSQSLRRTTTGVAQGHSIVQARMRPGHTFPGHASPGESHQAGSSTPIMPRGSQSAMDLSAQAAPKAQTATAIQRQPIDVGGLPQARVTQGHSEERRMVAGSQSALHGTAQGDRLNLATRMVNHHQFSALQRGIDRKTEQPGRSLVQRRLLTSDPSSSPTVMTRQHGGQPAPSRSMPLPSSGQPVLVQGKPTSGGQTSTSPARLDSHPGTAMGTRQRIRSMGVQRMVRGGMLQPAPRPTAHDTTWSQTQGEMTSSIGRGIPTPAVTVAWAARVNPTQAELSSRSERYNPMLTQRSLLSQPGPVRSDSSGSLNRTVPSASGSHGSAMALVQRSFDPAPLTSMPSAKARPAHGLPSGAQPSSAAGVTVSRSHVDTSGRVRQLSNVDADGVIARGIDRVTEATPSPSGVPQPAAVVQRQLAAGESELARSVARPRPLVPLGAGSLSRALGDSQIIATQRLSSGSAATPMRSPLVSRQAIDQQSSVIPSVQARATAPQSLPAILPTTHHPMRSDGGEANRSAVATALAQDGTVARWHTVQQSVQRATLQHRTVAHNSLVAATAMQNQPTTKISPVGARVQSRADSRLPNIGTTGRPFGLQTQADRDKNGGGSLTLLQRYGFGTTVSARSKALQRRAASGGAPVAAGPVAQGAAGEGTTVRGRLPDIGVAVQSFALQQMAEQSNRIAVPSSLVPSPAVPSPAVPSPAVPSSLVPSSLVPSSLVPSSLVQRTPARLDRQRPLSGAASPVIGRGIAWGPNASTSFAAADQPVTSAGLSRNQDNTLPVATVPANQVQMRSTNAELSRSQLPIMRSSAAIVPVASSVASRAANESIGPEHQPTQAGHVVTSAPTISFVGERVAPQRLTTVGERATPHRLSTRTSSRASGANLHAAAVIPSVQRTTERAIDGKPASAVGVLAARAGGVDPFRQTLAARAASPLPITPPTQVSGNAPTTPNLQAILESVPKQMIQESRETPQASGKAGGATWPLVAPRRAVQPASSSQQHDGGSQQSIAAPTGLNTLPHSYLQRSGAEAGSNSPAAPAPTNTIMNGSGIPMASRSVDELELERIADAVYTMIEQRLRREREYMGL